MGVHAKNLVGQRFGRLLVIERDAIKTHHAKWICKCDCGEVKSVFSMSLIRGDTLSCGCLGKELVELGTNRKHGLSKTGSYNSWNTMRQRCLDPKNVSYHYYGGRGIKICPRWLKFENFYADMGDRPEGMSLDRIDVNGDYCLENCRWATLEQQANNKRKTVLLSSFGETKTASQWSKTSGIKAETIKNRLASGMDTIDAITTPKYASTVKLIELHGESMSLAEWAKRYGLTETTIRWRLKRGYSLLDAITTPSQQGKRTDLFTPISSNS